MGGQYGVSESVKTAATLASLVNVSYKLVKGNWLAVFELAGTFNLLSGVKFEDFKKEVLELDEMEREQVEQAFSMKLDLADKVLQARLGDSADAINEIVDLVNEAMQVVDHGKSIVVRVKTILGV